MLILALVVFDLPLVHSSFFLALISCYCFVLKKKYMSMTQFLTVSHRCGGVGEVSTH